MKHQLNAKESQKRQPMQLCFINSVKHYLFSELYYVTLAFWYWPFLKTLVDAQCKGLGYKSVQHFWIIFQLLFQIAHTKQLKYHLILLPWTLLELIPPFLLSPTFNLLYSLDFGAHAWFKEFLLIFVSSIQK